MTERFKPTDVIRLMLTAEDFTVLVRGGIIRQAGVAIFLDDIGHAAMHAAIEEAEGLR